MKQPYAKTTSSVRAKEFDRTFRIFLTVLAVAPMLLSFFCWLIPGEDFYLRGFSQRSELTVSSIAVLACWALMVAISVNAGFSIGDRLSNKELGQEALSFKNSKACLLLSELVACAGLLAAYSSVLFSGELISIAMSGQMNAVSDFMKQGGGLHTLRYASIAAASLGIILFSEKQIGPIRLAFDAVLLLFMALASSRLALIMTLVITAIYALRAYERKLPRRITDIKVKWVIAVFAVLLAGFALSALLNYSRNSGYYKMAGVSNLFLMNYYQIISYFDTPTQAAIGVAGDGFLEFLFADHPPERLFSLIIPTFFQHLIGSDTGMALSVYEQAAIDMNPSFNTNSVFADQAVLNGLPGLLVALLMLALYACLFRILLGSRDVCSCIALGAIAYVILAAWRVYMANQGIVIFLVILSLALMAVNRVVEFRKRS